jgi:surfeit locus 1 family protein
VTGYVHPGDMPGLFSATDSPATREFYTLNPAAIGAALGLHNVAPFILVALGPTPPDGYPDPAKHLPRPPNNHLSYAITWYGLAAALVVIFVVWTRKALTA